MTALEYLSHNPVQLAIYAGLLGAMVGSFLNVMIYRLPIMLERAWREESEALLSGETSVEPAESEQETFNLMVPRSRCSACETPIKAQHNIPVLSYLLLGGKCVACKAPYSARYPLVEAITALLSATVAWHFSADIAAVGLALLLTWSLIALTGIDYDTYLLPDNITLPLVWLGLIGNYFGVFTDFSSAFWGAVAGYMTLWSVFWLFKLVTGKEGMGYGDFKLLAALGAWMGWQMLPAVIILSSLVGAVIGIALIVLKGRDSSKPIPFGPYLAIAGWIALIWGAQINAWYQSYAGIA